MTTTAKNIDCSFVDFLQTPATTSVFEIDLRNATLREVVETMISVKERTHHNYGKRYSGLLGHLSAIEMMSHTIIRPEQITDVFWTMFQNYLSDNKGLKNSTINSLCDQLHNALKWGSLHNASVSKTYDMYDRRKAEITKVTLSPSDIARIYYFDVMKIKGRRKHHLQNLKKVKDMLVLSCCLGQRYSDLIRITPDCFEDGVFKIKQKKTQNKAVVDIKRFAFDSKIAREILVKYNYYAPYTCDISNYNKLVKELLKYVGMESDVSVVEKKRGKMETKTDKLWKRVTSHIGRRSFATNATTRNLPRYEIMRATGHSTESSFNKYIVYND